MRYHLQLLGMVLAVSLCLPLPVFAVKAHTQDCNTCHRSGANPRSMANMCTPCHERDVDPLGRFTSAKASDALASHPNHLFPALITGDLGDQTSHFWGGSSSSKAAAGSTYPLSTFYSSRYSISTKKVTCSICHDPHKELGTQLVRATTANDLICKQCHTNWFILNDSADANPGNDTNALLTHPVVTDYATFAAANPTNYNPTPSNNSNGGSGEVRLVNGGVSCTSCHGVHFADSDSATIDGRDAANNETLAEGDGHLLRADGPAKANKSALCQSCHTYQEHGKVGHDASGSGAGDVQIGCLVCHSGHSFDATAPNYYVLRKSVDTLAAGFGPQTTLYTTLSTSWGSYCGSCHDINNIPPDLRGAAHSVGEDCSMCHAHNATTYSFGKASSGTACSSCHGAPPRTDTAADRDNNVLPDTGYAVGSSGINYRSANQNGKDESQTPHKLHAGALNEDKAPTDYAFGSGTVLAACLPCHNDKEDAVDPPSPSHDKADSNLSFQDVHFSTFATYNGVLTSYLYKTTNPNQWMCSGIYCHSNGGKRTGAAKVLADFKTATTKSWEYGSTTNKIVGTATECQQCHGENRASMAFAQKNNSPTHDKHLLKLGDDKTKCYLCHSATVDSTGTIPAAARDHRFGGTHVNGTVNVVFSTTALNAELVGGTYPADNSGTCIVYCHSDAIGGPPALVPDWDFATGTIVCGSCHGITAATLTSGSHPIHIDSTKAKVSCSSCHGDNAHIGTHNGHVDGIVTLRAKADSCNSCHGVELVSGKSWDIEPNWGQNSSVDCRTCHTGAVLTSYVNTASTTIVVNTANNLGKTLHESDGHSRSTPFTLTGKPAASKNCSACHVTLIDLGTGHVDGLGNSKLLIGGFSCEACHTAAGSRSGEATVRVKTHSNAPTYGYTKKGYNLEFTKTCLACHDPHGTSNGAMIENLRSRQNGKDATANYAGDVVFTSLGDGIPADSFDEPDGVNTDDLCATCHSTTLHNNQDASGTHNSYEGTNCTTTCHQHNGAKGGFMPAAGTACNDCHGNPPTASDPRPAESVGAHAAHTKVGTHAPSEDLYDCAVCHQGGETFALDGAHSSAPLVAGIGYNAGDGTCSGACHLSTAIDGYWNDNNGLDCTSCHNNVVKPLSLTHNKHFAAGKVCIDCHTAPEAADAGAHPDIDVKRTHITDHDAWSLNATNDGTVLADRGDATQDEATVVVPTWNDGANTCSNAACHNPSGLSNTATWGNTNGVGCNFCHSSTNPDTGKGTPGSHGAHMNAAGTFGITTIACTSCHPNNTLNSHLNSAVDLNGGFVYSASLTDYTSSTWGQCTTTTCHNNGKGVAVQTPVAWGTAYDNCTICHNNGSGAAQPNTGRHNRHVANTSYVASACGNCHANATATTMTNATTHINGTAQTGIDITDHTAGTATCTNNCHLVDSARGDWLDANFLICTDCHGRAGSAGGAYPTSGLHTGTLTVSANTHDNSFQVTKGGASTGTCETCHTGINLAGDLPATHIAGGAAAPAQAALAIATLGYTAGATPTCTPNNTLVTCHDDRGGWKRRWSTTATASNGTQCGNCHGTFDLTFVTDIGQRHGSDPQVHGGHNGIDDCYICHTYKAGDTTYYNIANAPVGQHRDGSIQLNNGMVFTDDGATVHCTGCHDTVPLGLGDGEYSFQDTYNGDGADGGLNRWGRTLQAGPPANCNGCHVTNGLDHDGVNESLSVHIYHTGSPLSPGCGACHPADSGPGGALHQNNSLDFGGTYLLSLTSYAVTPGVGGSFANTNCSTANGCHNSIIDSWKTGSLGTGTQPCIACHASGKLLDQLGYPPTSNEHSAHRGNNAYVGTTASNDCDDCHGAGSSTGSHGATHSNGVKNVTNKVNDDYNASLGTCTNTCHNVVDGRDWTSNTTLDCIDCHSGTAPVYIGKANKNNTSGLHQADVALAHDDAFPRPNAAPDGTCTSCHTTINLTTPASHVDGVTSDPNTAFGLFASYDTTAASTCSGAGVATNCHSDGGDWTRKWNNVENDKPQPADDPATATVCGNCHGTFFTGWNSLSASHIDPDLENSGDQMQAGGHLVCEKCHGWGNASYNKTWLGSSNINYDGHGDGHITMNGPVGTGTGYNPDTRGCDTINCHGASTLTLNATSGWPINYGNFGGAGACGACHDDGAIPPNSGAHAAHGADNDSDYSECEACHGTNNGGDWATGSGGTHNTGSVNFAAGITYSDGGTAGTNAAAANDTCSTTQCHSKSPEVATWGTPASLGCDECHNATATVVANNAGRTLSDSHNTHFAKGKTCNQCHSVPGTRAHILAGSGTDGFILTGRANAAQDEAIITITAASIDGGNSCSGTTGIGLGCHNTKPTPAWGTTGIGCSNCHVPGGGAAYDPASGLHNMTATNVQPHNATLRTGCTECHASMTSDPATHIDGVWEADANNNMTGGQPRFLSGTRTALDYSEGAANSSTCWDNGVINTTTGLDYNGGASCHRDNGVWKRLWSTAANVDMSILANQDPGLPVCDVCHGQYASSAGWREGSVHYRSGNNAAEAKGSSHNKTGGNANKCKDCHAYYPGGVSNHENTILNFSGTGVATLPNYALTAGTSGLYCASCHNANSAEVATDSGTHTFPATTIFGSPVYVGGPTLPEGSCTNCHGNTAAGNFWPDDTTGHTAPGQYKVVPNDINQMGEHVVHVLEIAKKLYGTPTPTIAQRNATCNYCHPGNSHGGVDADLPADVSNTDTDDNGSADVENVLTDMKKLIGGTPDTAGFWRRTPGTCSNVACHASAPYTPHWYGDTVAPGQITDLELQANTEPGTVKLLWNAPGDDDYLDGTAYAYDVRWSTSSINDGNFASANQALAPTVRRQRNSGLIPKNQEVILKGLPAGTLYFAVKTADERFPNAAAWSPLSNVVSGTAKTDTAAPVFTGVSAVASTDFNFNIEANPDTNGVYVSWEAGRDHSHGLATPLNYLVLWSTYSLRTHFANGGPMPTTIGTDTCFDKSKTGAQLVNAVCGTITPASNEYRVKSASTTALGYAVTGLPVNTVYNFLVRAKDANNIDSNRVELSAMAKPTAFKTITLKTLKTSAAIPTASTGWTPTTGTAITASTSDAPLDTNMRGTSGTFSLGTNAIAFSPTTTYTEATNVWGLKFQIKITGVNTATTVTYQFGYLTNKVFTPFAAVQTLTISKKMPIRLVSFPLANYKGTVPSGSKPAFIVKASQSVTLTYGADVDKGGILLFNEQPYNNLPPAATSLGQTQQPSSYIGGNLYRLTWTQPSADANGDAVHYDVFGSTDGTNFPYVIGRNLTTTTVDWDPVGDGITGSTGTARFKVIVGDDFREGAMYLNDATPQNADNDNHNETISSAFTINNTADVWAPAAIGSATGTGDDLVAETRPKQGGVSLTWKAVGNDGFNHGTRATVYDIRFSPDNIPDVATFDALPPENQATNEPFPDFTGAMERYELLGLNPETTYYFAMRVGDGTNWSGLSNVASISAGPKCGICHATPPNETATAGNHIEHGYTMNDCANCHGNDADPDDGGIFGAQFFKTDHQDGILKLGWKTKYPAAATTLVNDDIVYYQGATKIYEDLDGAGGVVKTPTQGDLTDDGTCFGFAGTNTSGCHGPASPGWQEGVPLACSACHGDGGRTTDQYGRAFDATIDNGMTVPNQVLASPAVDNHGGSTGRYVGAHLKHLNSSFRLAKGDNCMLCHKDNIHADGNVDIAYDISVTGTDAAWDTVTPGPNGGGTCGSTSVDNCHGSNTPEWHTSATVACNLCHGFGGVTPSHVTDPNGGVSTPGTGNCTTCHPAGHPQGTLQDTSSIMIPNNPLVGTAYRSGGIHLKKVISGRSTMNDSSAIDTEAEICWGCHEDNAISEWGLDDGANNNTVDTVTLRNDYNYGTLHTTSALTTGTTRWVNDSLQGAYWKTGINNTTIQGIKKARIQSTHSTDPSGTSAVSYDATNKHYDETVDSLAIIRCSNCHDVHNMNKAPGDATSGKPYLRGSWKNNPYAEDAPPIANTAYAEIATFGGVPRGGTDRKYLGGYFIDQNNAQPGTPTTTANGTASEYPTTGWTTTNSAGICVLCHGEDVDNLDQLADSGGLWLGTNGHSNSAIGGTFVNFANIFDNASSSLNPGGLSGRPTPVTSLTWTVQVPDMAYQAQANAATTTAYGYRGPDSGEASQYLPNNTARYGHVSYNWGVTVDANTPDLMYHQFSCSKCHNPHASRLPKLLITNCLDIQHNTWDNASSSQQANYTAAALTNVDRFSGTGEYAAYYASAQNCHRYNQKRKDAGQTNPGGWNKVTPWTTAHP